MKLGRSRLTSSEAHSASQPADVSLGRTIQPHPAMVVLKAIAKKVNTASVRKFLKMKVLYITITSSGMIQVSRKNILEAYEENKKAMREIQPFRITKP